MEMFFCFPYVQDVPKVTWKLWKIEFNLRKRFNQDICIKTIYQWGLHQMGCVTKSYFPTICGASFWTASLINFVSLGELFVFPQYTEDFNDITSKEIWSCWFSQTNLMPPSWIHHDNSEIGKSSVYIITYDECITTRFSILLKAYWAEILLIVK